MDRHYRHPYLARKLGENGVRVVRSAPGAGNRLAYLVGAFAVGLQQPELGGKPRSPIDSDPGICRFSGRCPKGQSSCAT
jgi:hypothetical protein